MRTLNILISISLMVGTVIAAPSFRGPLPQEQKDIIHYMAEHHSEFKRVVEVNENGYTATTTSENSVLIEKLKTHFSYMEKRLDSGAMVRRWDPAYKELVEWYDQLTATITLLDNGIKVTISGKTQEAAKVAQNHARIVSEFIAEGQEAVSRAHKTALKK